MKTIETQTDTFYVMEGYVKVVTKPVLATMENFQGSVDTIIQLSNEGHHKYLVVPAEGFSFDKEARKKAKQLASECKTIVAVVQKTAFIRLLMQFMTAVDGWKTNFKGVKTEEEGIKWLEKQ